MEFFCLGIHFAPIEKQPSPRQDRSPDFEGAFTENQGWRKEDVLEKSRQWLKEKQTAKKLHTNPNKHQHLLLVSKKVDLALT